METRIRTIPKRTRRRRTLARREFTLDVATLVDPWLVMKQTGMVEVFVNDSHAITLNTAASRTAPAYLSYYLDEGVRQNLREGRNVVSVHWKQNKGDCIAIP